MHPGFWSHFILQRGLVSHFTLQTDLSSHFKLRTKNIVIDKWLHNEEILNPEILIKSYKQEYIPVGYVPSAAVAILAGGVSALGGVSAREVSAQGRGVCLWGICPGLGVSVPHCGQNNRRLWKHYLSATTVADGKYRRSSPLNTVHDIFTCNVFDGNNWWCSHLMFAYAWSILLFLQVPETRTQHVRCEPALKHTLTAFHFFGNLFSSRRFIFKCLW